MDGWANERIQTAGENEQPGRNARMCADEKRLAACRQRTQLLSQAPRANEYRQRILRLEVKREVSAAVAAHLRHEPPAFRDDDRSPSGSDKRAIQVADDGLDAALLHRRNEMNDRHVALAHLREPLGQHGQPWVACAACHETAECRRMRGTPVLRRVQIGDN